MTTRHALLLGLGLTLAATGMGFCADDDEEPNPAEPAVKRLADQAGKKDWAALSKEGGAVAEKLNADTIELLFVMLLFKKGKGTLRGGTSIDPGLEEGIQTKLMRLSRGVTANDLRDAKALTRMTRIMAAVAAIVTHIPNEKANKTPGDIKKWRDYSREMHGASLRLAKTLEGKDRAAVQKAAKKLLDACTNCHNDYR
jgi:hypothetical protein